MQSGSLQIGWFDWMTLIVLVAGLMVGRKRGMSTELLDVFQWLLMVVAASYLYKQTGELLNSGSFFSIAFSYVLAYILIVILVKALFMGVRRALGGKLIGSDIFGRFEYYLGMMAGMVRFACMLLIGMALLHAPYYSLEEVERARKKQQENFGDVSFPTIATLQKDVFKGSMTGRFAERHLPEMLIQKSRGPARPLRGREGPAKRTEKVMEEFAPSKP